MLPNILSSFLTQVAPYSDIFDGEGQIFKTFHSSSANIFFLQLCKQIGHHVNITGICSQLASGGAYEGVVDLCLSVASQRDPTGRALHYYKNNEPAEDHQGYLAFTAR